MQPVIFCVIALRIPPIMSYRGLSHHCAHPGPPAHLRECPATVLHRERNGLTDSRQYRILASLRARSRICRNLSSDEGQSLVEFALTLPLILLSVTGILVFGVAFNNYMMLTDATSIAARQLAISRGQTLDPCATVVSAVSSAAPMLKPANMTFNISLNGTRYTSTSCSGSSTSGAPANMVLGSTATVTVTYPCSLSLFRDLISSSFLLTAQTSELMQ